LSAAPNDKLGISAAVASIDAGADRRGIQASGASGSNAGGIQRVAAEASGKGRVKFDEPTTVEVIPIAARDEATCGEGASSECTGNDRGGRKRTGSGGKRGSRKAAAGGESRASPSGAEGYHLPNAEPKIMDCDSAGPFAAPTHSQCPELEGDQLEERPETGIGQGATYRGQWKGNLQHGEGVLIRPDGHHYEGSFVDGQCHGHGSLRTKSGSSYVGEWVQNRVHGQGKYCHMDGTTYDGEWFQDAKSGKGVEMWTDGSRYQGDFFSGRKHGTGTYISSTGAVYEGQFRGDRMHGQGFYKFWDGRSFDGQWVNGHMNGNGTMEWPSGAKYVGGYQDDTKHGEGTFTWPDGRAYRGQWEGGKQHGSGISFRGGSEVPRRGIWNAGTVVTSEPALDETLEGPKKAIQSAETGGNDSDSSSDGSDGVAAGSAIVDRHARDMLLIAGASRAVLARNGSAGNAMARSSTASAKAVLGSSEDAPCWTPEASDDESCDASECSVEEKGCSNAPNSIAGTPQLAAAERLVGDAADAGAGAVGKVKPRQLPSFAMMQAGARMPALPSFDAMVSGETARAVPRAVAHTTAAPAVTAPAPAALVSAAPASTEGFGQAPAPPSPTEADDTGRSQSSPLGAPTATTAVSSHIDRSGGPPDEVQTTREQTENQRKQLSLVEMMQSAVQSVEDGPGDPTDLGAQNKTEAAATKDVHRLEVMATEGGSTAEDMSARHSDALQHHMRGNGDDEGSATAVSTCGEPDTSKSKRRIVSAFAHTSSGPAAAGDRPLAAGGLACPTPSLGAAEPTASGNVESAPRPTAGSAEKLLSYPEFQQWLYGQTVDYEVMQPLRDELVSKAQGCGCLGLQRLRASNRSKASVPGLHKNLWSDKDLVLCLQCTDFDPAVVAHWRMLMTIHARLTTSQACPHVGQHWEVLGFTNTDPRADLNAFGGVLNVIHLFVFLSLNFKLLRDIYWLAVEPQCKFPFAFVSLSITRMVLDALVAGRLSKLCNKAERGVFDTTCDLHAAGLYHFYSRWRSRKTPELEVGLKLGLREVRSLVESKPTRLLSDFSTNDVGGPSGGHGECDEPGRPTSSGLNGSSGAGPASSLTRQPGSHRSRHTAAEM